MVGLNIVTFRSTIPSKREPFVNIAESTKSAKLLNIRKERIPPLLKVSLSFQRYIEVLALSRTLFAFSRLSDSNVFRKEKI